MKRSGGLHNGKEGKEAGSEVTGLAGKDSLEGIRKYCKKENFFVMILLGVLLFVVALPVKEASSGKKEKGEENPKPVAEKEQISYVEELESRLKRILSSVEGAGEVEVMVTLRASEEKVIEMERQTNVSSNHEEDAQGGSRTVKSSEANPKVVYYTDGSVSDPYVIKVKVPEIEGVLVVAQGAGRGTMDRTISGIVQTLFGVEAHRVKVVKMEKNDS